MHAVAGPENLCPIALINSLFLTGEVIFSVDIHINGNDIHFKLFAFFQQCPVVVVQIFAVLPTGLAAVVIISESILIGPGNMLKNHNFRHRLEFAEFSNEPFHTFE